MSSNCVDQDQRVTASQTAARPDTTRMSLDCFSILSNNSTLVDKVTIEWSHTHHSPHRVGLHYSIGVTQWAEIRGEAPAFV